MMRNNFFNVLRRIISFVLIFSIGIGPSVSHAQSAFIATLPEPGVMVAQSAVFVPVLVRGLVIHPDKPLNFDFIVDSGNDLADQAVIKEQSERIAKYFLAAVTVPEDQLWVNLSPYEKDRIIENDLGATVLGRDMLAQDYVLKQLTASLIYPEQGLGKEFWAKIYQQAQEQFGTSDIPVDTFNKVWIMPEKAEIFEKNNAVYVTDAKLKVMLDADHQVMNNISLPLVGRDQGRGDTQDLTKDLLRTIIIPALEKEVNEGKNFAVIRQVYHAAILAKWYRELIQDTLLADAYVGKNKVSGVTTDEKALKEEIYQRYIAAYKKGVFNYIKEEVTATSETLPRKYFSGGIEDFAMKNVLLSRTTDAAAVSQPIGKLFQVDMTMGRPENVVMGDVLKKEYRNRIQNQFEQVRKMGLLPAADIEAGGHAVLLSADKEKFNSVAGVILNPLFTGRKHDIEYTIKDSSDYYEATRTRGVLEVKIGSHLVNILDFYEFYPNDVYKDMSVGDAWLKEVFYKAEGVSLFSVVQERAAGRASRVGIKNQRMMASALFVIPMEDLGKYRLLSDSINNATLERSETGVRAEIDVPHQIKLSDRHIVLVPRIFEQIAREVFKGQGAPKVIAVDVAENKDERYPDYETAVKEIIQVNPGVQFFAHIMRLPTENDVEINDLAKLRDSADRSQEMVDPAMKIVKDVVYQDAVANPELKGADRDTKADFVDVGRATRLKFSNWEKRTAEPFTQEEQDKFNDPRFASEDLTVMKKEEVKNIRHTIYNRSSGNVVILAIVTDVNEQKHYYRLSGATTTSMAALKNLMVSLTEMKAPGALMQVSAGNQGDLPGNFTLISEGKRWNIFGAVDERFDRRYRVVVQHTKGSISLERVQIIRSAGAIKVYLVRGEAYALSDEELPTEGIDFILAAMPLLWDGKTEKSLLQESYVNTADLRHIFRFPNGTIFYDQVAQDQQKLQKAFHGQMIEIKVSNKSDINLLQKIGYVAVDQQDNIKSFGDYWFDEGAMTLRIILLPARYPLNALVIGKNGEKAFVEVKGESRERGADYWTVGEWVRKEVLKTFGWEPQAVVALDNGKDPSVVLYPEGKDPTYLIKGREAVNASLSVVNKDPISIDGGDIVYRDGQWLPAVGNDPEKVQFVKTEFNPKSGVDMRLFLNKKHHGKYTIMDRMTNVMRKVLVGGGLKEIEWDVFLKDRIKLDVVRAMQEKELEKEGRVVFSSTSSDNLYANRPVVAFQDGNVFYSMEPDGTYSKKEADGTVSNVETRRHPMWVMWTADYITKDGRKIKAGDATIEEGVRFKLEKNLGTTPADMYIGGENVTDKVGGATFVIPIMRNGDFVTPNESNDSIDWYDDVKHLISSAVFSGSDYPDIQVSGGGGLYFGIDQLLEDKELLKRAVEKPVTLKLSLPLPTEKVNFSHKEEQEKLSKLLTEKLTDEKVIAGYREKKGDELVKERGDFKINLTTGTVEIFFKENNYPFHLIGTKKDGTVVDVAVYAKKQLYGATVRRSFELMQQLGVYNAGILDQGNTVRVTQRSGLEDKHLFHYKGRYDVMDENGMLNLTSELYYTVKKAELAQTKDAAASVSASNVGGIDIKNIDVSRAGKAKIAFDDAVLRETFSGGFNGFTPVFIKMTPVEGPLMALGVTQP